MSQAQYTEQITRLIEQQGQSAARAAEQRGQIWGGALASLGQIPAQIQQAHHLQQQQQLQQQEMGLRTQQLGLEVDKASRETADRQATRSALQDSGGDLESAIPAIMQTNPEAGLKLQEALREQQRAKLQTDAAMLDYHRKINDTIADHLGPVADATDPASQQAALASAHQALKKLGIPTDDLPTQAGPEATAKANALRQGTMSAKDQLAAKQKALEDEIKKLTADSQAKDRIADNERQAKAQQSTEAYQAGMLKNSGRQADAAMVRAQAAGARAKAESAPLDLTPAGLDAAALNYVKTGQLPPLGMGDKTTRKAIINRAAEIGSGTGEPMRTSLDVAANRAGFGADSQSLKHLQGQRDAIGAFEQTATKNIDLFLDTAGKVVDTGSPLANTFIRAASGKLLGSPNQAQYDAARQVAVNEIAKITSNPNLSGTLSDSARHEVDAFNPANATLKQTVAVMRLLKTDMANRTKALDEQIATIKGRMGGKTSSDGPPKPTHRFNPATGKVEPIP